MFDSCFRKCFRETKLMTVRSHCPGLFSKLPHVGQPLLVTVTKLWMPSLSLSLSVFFFQGTIKMLLPLLILQLLLAPAFTVQLPCIQKEGAKRKLHKKSHKTKLRHHSLHVCLLNHDNL